METEENEIDFRSADKNYGVRIDIPSDGLKNLAKKLYLFFFSKKGFWGGIWRTRICSRK